MDWKVDEKELDEDNPSSNFCYYLTQPVLALTLDHSADHLISASTSLPCNAVAFYKKSGGITALVAAVMGRTHRTNHAGRLPCTSLPFCFAALPAVEVAPSLERPAEVSAADVRRVVERSLPFVEKSSATWRSERKCVTCHQVPFAVWALTEAKSRGLAVDAAKLDDLTAWSFNFCATSEDASTTTFMVLSQNSNAPRPDALKNACALFREVVRS